MPNYKNIVITNEQGVDTIWLNRPEVHNAIDPLMIAELSSQIGISAAGHQVKLIVIRGKGPSFSSGADLGYMQMMSSFSERENIEDAERLAELFYSIYTCPKPVFTIAHGNVAGGANGILAASDYALCTHRTLFRFSETKLGLVPATISPYIIRRVGECKALELMLTGKPFSGEEAEEWQLVNNAVSDKEFDSVISDIIRFFLSSATQASIATKALVRAVSGKEISANIKTYTSEILAKIRASDEAKEGLAAFFEKRKPNWNTL